VAGPIYNDANIAVCREKGESSSEEGRNVDARGLGSGLSILRRNMRLPEIRGKEYAGRPGIFIVRIMSLKQHAMIYYC